MFLSSKQIPSVTLKQHLLTEYAVISCTQGVSPSPEVWAQAPERGQTARLLLPKGSPARTTIPHHPSGCSGSHAAFLSFSDATNLLMSPPPHHASLPGPALPPQRHTGTPRCGDGACSFLHRRLGKDEPLNGVWVVGSLPVPTE